MLIAVAEKSQQYTNKSGSLLYNNIGNTVFPTPQPISKTVWPDRTTLFSKLLSFSVSYNSGNILKGRSISCLTSLGANSGNSVNSQCLSLKNLKYKNILIKRKNKFQLILAIM
jgi:hypothetical protein